LVCGISQAQKRLGICPVCYARTCRDHAFRRSGKHFCSEECAAMFFYGTGEDEEEETEQ